MPKSRRVLLLLGYYVRKIHHGVAAYAHKMGWMLDASMSHFGKVPLDWHGDGIIAFSGDRPDIIGKIMDERVPAVEMFDGAGLPHLPRVWIDNKAIGRMAGEYLIANGFRHIGYFHFDPHLANLKNEEERSAGLREVVEEAGRQFHSITFHGGISQIRKLPRPLALMAQNDLVGDLLIHRLLDAKIRVPRDVAVIGVDSDDIYQTFSLVPQTCVDSNTEYQGYAAAQVLDSLMSGRGKPAPANPIMIRPTRIIERESTSPFLCKHLPTNKALRYMREHFTENIHVNDIAKHAGLSRYHLNEHFKFHTGETIAHHLLRMRLDRARQRLAETDEKIQSLALDAGFGTSEYFSTIFRQKTGLTPAEFRRLSKIRNTFEQSV